METLIPLPLLVARLSALSSRKTIACEKPHNCNGRHTSSHITVEELKTSPSAECLSPVVAPISQFTLLSGEDTIVQGAQEERKTEDSVELQAQVKYETPYSSDYRQDSSSTSIGEPRQSSSPQDLSPAVTPILRLSELPEEDTIIRKIQEIRKTEDGVEVVADVEWASPKLVYLVAIDWQCTKDRDEVKRSIPEHTYNAAEKLSLIRGTMGVIIYRAADIESDVFQRISKLYDPLQIHNLR